MQLGVLSNLGLGSAVGAGREGPQALRGHSPAWTPVGAWP